MKRKIFLAISEEISMKLKDIKTVWDGREAIMEMKEANFPHWKQMEWIGWYFQFLCERALKAYLDIPKPRYGNVNFDGFK